jgi:hypothetical protein
MFLVASGRRGPYPHTDAGVEVRRILHRLRHVTIENLNEHFKALFEAHGPVPTRGRLDTARFALGAVFVYQLALCSIVTSKIRGRTAGSKPSSEPLEQL